MSTQLSVGINQINMEYRFVAKAKVKVDNEPTEIIVAGVAHSFRSALDLAEEHLDEQGAYYEIMSLALQPKD